MPFPKPLKVPWKCLDISPLNILECITRVQEYFLFSIWTQYPLPHLWKSTLTQYRHPTCSPSTNFNISKCPFIAQFIFKIKIWLRYIHSICYWVFLVSHNLGLSSYLSFLMMLHPLTIRSHMSCRTFHPIDLSVRSWLNSDRTFLAIIPQRWRVFTTHIRRHRIAGHSVIGDGEPDLLVNVVTVRLLHFTLIPLPASNPLGDTLR